MAVPSRVVAFNVCFNPRPGVTYSPANSVSSTALIPRQLRKLVHFHVWIIIRRAEVVVRCLALPMALDGVIQGIDGLPQPDQLVHVQDRWRTRRSVRYSVRETDELLAQVLAGLSQALGAHLHDRSIVSSHASELQFAL